MVNWDLLVENWDSLGSWAKDGTGTIEINPAGQLHTLATASGGCCGAVKDIGTLPDDYTVEIKLMIDSFGSGGNGRIQPEFYDGTHRVCFQIYSNKIRNPDSGTEIALTTNVGVWYVWRAVIDSSSHSLKVYRNNAYIGELGNGLNFAPSDGYVYAGHCHNGAGETNCESHEDYIYIASGLYPPAGQAWSKTVTEILGLTDTCEKYELNRIFGFREEGTDFKETKFS